MNANQYRARLAEGIPPGSLAKANRLTLLGINGGYNTSAVGYQNRSTFDQARAGYAVNLELAHSSAKPFPIKNSPYSALISRQYYGAGLGDDDPISPGLTEDDIAEAYGGNLITNVASTQALAVASPSFMAPQSTSGSSSQWADILNSGSSKSVFAGLGTGLANLIGGTKSLTLSPTLLPSSAPSLGTMLLIGGGLAAAFFLFKRSSAT